MSSRLFVFGDSWPAGADLADARQAFPFLIGQRLNLDTVNLAVPGTSIDQAVHAFLNAIGTINKDAMVLFCLTGMSRSIKFHGLATRELHPMSDEPESTAYYKHIYTDELGEFNCLRNLLLVQELTKRQQIKTYFVSNWDLLPDSELIDQRYVYKNTLLELVAQTSQSLDTQVDWKAIKPLPGHWPLSKLIVAGHPTEQGHQKIAEHLTEWILNNE